MRFFFLSCVLLYLSCIKVFAQTCLDVHLKELNSAEKMPQIKGFCYDSEGFWKLWKEAANYTKTSKSTWKASYCYGLAFDYGFKVSIFNLDYCSFLVTNNRLDEALKVLQQIPPSDDLYNNGMLKQAEILIWLGEYKKAKNLLMRIEAGEKGLMGRSKQNLARTSDSLSSPVIQYEALCNFDNQPLGYFGNGLIFRKGSSALLNYQIAASNSSYFGEEQNQQYEIYGQNTFSFRRFNTALTLGIGASMFDFNSLRLTYHAEARNQITTPLTNVVRFERKVYDLTRGSLGKSLLVDQISNSLKYSVRSGFSFECFASYGSLANRTSAQWNLYSWGLSPYLLKFPLALRVGGFLGYSNSTNILFESIYTYNELLDLGLISNLPGVFPTWFTPNNMSVGGMITDLEFDPNKHWNLHLTSTLGYGLTHEPFLFLVPNGIGLDSYRKKFIPVDVKFSTNYTVNKTITLKLNYEFRITVFNRANYASLTFSKRLP